MRRPFIGPGGTFGRTGREAAIRLIVLVTLFAVASSIAGLVGSSTGDIIALGVVGVALTAWATVVRYRALKSRNAVAPEASDSD
jgi:Kef-type K+ transport system membrane component KefB